MKDTTGLIFVHDYNKDLKELTNNRTIASIPFGGRYRMIDFTMSNLVNSGVSTIGVVANNKYHSLMDHLGSGKDWDLNRKRNGLYILPPYVNIDNTYINSKIKDIFNAFTFLKRSRNKYVLLTEGSVVCNINYDELLDFHISKNAYITAVFKEQEYNIDRYSNNAFIETSESGRVTDLIINPGISLYNKMLVGTYIIEREYLEFLVMQCIAHNKFDFEKDILQQMINGIEIYAYEFDGYMEKIDTIDVFFKANMDTLDSHIRDELFFKNGNIGNACTYINHNCT